MTGAIILTIISGLLIAGAAGVGLWVLKHEDLDPLYRFQEDLDKEGRPRR